MTVAIGQFIPILLYAPSSLAAMSPVILGLVVAFFAFLGYNVYLRRTWARTLTIFIQGFNIIVRIMLLISQGAAPLKRGGGINWEIVVTCLVAIALSALILYRFDNPEVELAFSQAR